MNNIQLINVGKRNEIFWGEEKGVRTKIRIHRLLKNLVENLFNTGIENISGLIEM